MCLKAHYSAIVEGSAVVGALSDDIARAAEPSGAKRATLGRIAELLERNGIDVDEVGAVRRVSLYQQVTKDPETGEPTVHDLTAVQLSPRWADGPEWPVVQPGPSVKLPTRKTSQVPADGSVCVVLPDMQIGYYRGADGVLVPTHDESALAAALAVTAAAKPDLVVLVGDNLDLPEMGKYRLTAPYQNTTQATIDRAAILCAEVRHGLHLTHASCGSQETTRNASPATSSTTPAQRSGCVEGTSLTPGLCYLCRTCVVLTTTASSI
jgi:hypothetical protein